MTTIDSRRIFRFVLTALFILSSVSLFALAQSDRDGDGIPDNQDSCVNRGNEGGLGVDASGCPYYDADWDGVYDRNDACPSRANEYGFGVGSDGCPLTAPPAQNPPPANNNPGDNSSNPDNSQNPEPDTTENPQVTEESQSTEEPHYGDRDEYRDADWDGFPDSEDACPWRGNEGGLGTDETGCPYYDADWDGVYDRDDACPWRADEYGFGIDETGCPLTGTPEITEEPTETVTPEITDEPIETVTPEITDEPTETVTPEITDEPTETVTPEITDEPTETVTPEITDEPTETVTPEITEEPTETVTPEITDEPTETATPEVTEEPTETVTPEVTEEPTETVTPEVTDEPTETPEPDSDNDGVVDSLDECPGFDDTLDNNQNGIPDDCEVNPVDRDGDGLEDQWELTFFGCVLAGTENNNTPVYLLPDESLAIHTQNGWAYLSGYPYMPVIADRATDPIPFAQNPEPGTPVASDYVFPTPYLNQNGQVIYETAGDCATEDIPQSGIPLAEWSYLACTDSDLASSTNMLEDCIMVALDLFDAQDDPDNDGCDNYCERFLLQTVPINYAGGAQGSDTDGDGLTDGIEIFMRTDPRNNDTDRDGIWDGEEVCEFVNPSDPTICDSLTRPDAIWTHTNPLLADTDLDGLDDGEELSLGTDPTDPDSDNDGVADGNDTCPLDITCQ